MYISIYTNTHTYMYISIPLMYTPWSTSYKEENVLSSLLLEGLFTINDRTFS